MTLLSIQSHVAYGHVGNTAAVFPLQRLGVDVWPVHTVQFSNHTGYGAWTGDVFTGDMIGRVIDGIAARGVLPRCEGVLSGYMGDAGIGAAILDAVARVRAANGKALYCCDPVMGDVGRGVFVRPGIPDFMRERAVPAADIITPNHFELSHLSGVEAGSVATLATALDAVHALGPRVILVTSVHLDDTPDNGLDLVVSTPKGRWRTRTPRLDVAVNGAGDIISALFFHHFLKTGDAGGAMACAAGSVFGLLAKTAEAGSREIVLVSAQDEIVTPSRMFDVVAL